MRTRARLGAAFVTAASVATLLVTTGTASAHDGSGRSHAHGKSPIADFDWHVSRDGDGHAHGFFSATDPSKLLVKLAGPATCVRVQGNKVGFLYRVEDHSRPFFTKGQYVLITGVDNGGRGRDRMGFEGPLPRAAFPGCGPSVAPFPVYQGHIDVSGDGDN